MRAFLSCAFMYRQHFYFRSICITLLLSVLLFSCKTKKYRNAIAKTENYELNDLSIKKSLRNEVSQWLGTPYKYGGNDKKGVDCSGFVCAIYKEVYAQNVPRTSQSLYVACKKIKDNELREGDLVFFNFNGKGVSHVGIYLSNNMYVHASTTKGVVISDLKNVYTLKNYVGAGRIKD